LIIKKTFVYLHIFIKQTGKPLNKKTMRTLTNDFRFETAAFEDYSQGRSNTVIS